uniref:NUDIX hydrolase 13, mitochondrial-like isoform X2 n=1 Tax=Tanacetum cinerariifolium TaxID=118510 RepID=A0A699KE21_TANCI|nr:NUDIX hydrolase 13, mitochondrial-like isoform X2 [Tanacetum cinerariifolium]GFA86567.1 NUDIX hydrolase 13, mitochondrial-like isoform X2 [Tanacetum cinerariifolium]
MVSLPNRDGMVFLKESDEIVEEAACRESLKEARGNPLGVWEFKSMTRQEAGINQGGCKGYIIDAPMNRL